MTHAQFRRWLSLGVSATARDCLVAATAWRDAMLDPKSVFPTIRIAIQERLEAAKRPAWVLPPENAQTAPGGEKSGVDGDVSVEVAA
jgi:hypothetical protein